MNRRTNISKHLTHKTQFIDPGSGQVLREGTTPTETLADYKANPGEPVVNTPQDDKIERMDNDIQEIKALLKQALK
jgi:hypothetical protein